MNPTLLHAIARHARQLYGWTESEGSATTCGRRIHVGGDYAATIRDGWVYFDARGGATKVAVYAFETDLEPGQHVVCDFRLPSSNQPWLTEMLVGEILAPSDDPATWQGTGSEADYCAAAGKLPVRYTRFGTSSSFVQHDPIASLRRVADDFATLPRVERLRLVLGEHAARNYQRASGDRVGCR